MPGMAPAQERATDEPCQGDDDFGANVGKLRRLFKDRRIDMRIPQEQRRGVDVRQPDFGRPANGLNPPQNRGC